MALGVDVLVVVANLVELYEMVVVVTLIGVDVLVVVGNVPAVVVNLIGLVVSVVVVGCDPVEKYVLVVEVNPAGVDVIVVVVSCPGSLEYVTLIIGIVPRVEVFVK